MNGQSKNGSRDTHEDGSTHCLGEELGGVVKQSFGDLHCFVAMVEHNSSFTRFQLYKESCPFSERLAAFWRISY